MPKSVKPESSATRRGARSRSAIGPELSGRLNRGEVEAASLSEGLAIDLEFLARHVGLDGPALQEVGYLRRMRGISRRIDDWKRFARNRSDTVRGWAALRLGDDADLSFPEKLVAMRRFAADPHFAVREWAWLALREPLIERLEEAIRLLAEWSFDVDPNIRRFASEATRPRGVWCRQIEELKRDPAPALPLLEPLRSDPSKYVRDSVGNWLNDAGKSAPDWVLALTRRWSKESKTKETAAIVKRGLRTLQR